MNSTEFVEKEHKFLQYVLAHSICGRRQSSGKVSQMDLLCLYGIIKIKSVHLGFVLGCLFQNLHSEKVDSIFLGSYVTRFIKNSNRVQITEPSYGCNVKITNAIMKKVFTYQRTKKQQKRPRTEVEEEEEDEDDECGADDEDRGHIGDTSAGVSSEVCHHMSNRS